MTTFQFTGAGPFTGAAHPTLDWAVTPDQRARAEDYLQRAYANGRITHDDFDRRIGIALGATTRRELNRAFDGLATITSEFPAGVLPTPAPNPFGYSTALSRTGGTTLGAAAQLSAPIMPLFGSGVIAAFTRPGGPAHREAAKAFNATVSAMVLMAVFGTMQHMVHPLALVTNLIGVLWFVFAMVGAVKAHRGDAWTNPFSRVLPIRLLNER